MTSFSKSLNRIRKSVNDWDGNTDTWDRYDKDNTVASEFENKHNIDIIEKPNRHGDYGNRHGDYGNRNNKKIDKSEESKAKYVDSSNYDEESSNQQESYNNKHEEVIDSNILSPQYEETGTNQQSSQKELTKSSRSQKLLVVQPPPSARSSIRDRDNSPSKIKKNLLDTNWNQASSKKLKSGLGSNSNITKSGRTDTKSGRTLTKSGRTPTKSERSLKKQKSDSKRSVNGSNKVLNLNNLMQSKDKNNETPIELLNNQPGESDRRVISKNQSPTIEYDNIIISASDKKIEPNDKIKR